MSVFSAVFKGNETRPTASSTPSLASREVERFNASQKRIASTFWNDYKRISDLRVVAPLLKLQETFGGPMRLVQKRNDKRLDFNASKQKSDKNHDPSKDKAVIFTFNSRRIKILRLFLHFLPSILRHFTKHQQKNLNELTINK